MPSFRPSPWLYGLALAALVLSGAAVRFGSPQTPFIDADTWGYLHPAYSKLTGGPFIHTNGRDTLYPAFLYAILKLGGDFRAISVVQHLFGLGTGALMAFAWNSFGRLLLAQPRAPLAWRLAGLLPAAAYVHSLASFEYEHSLRPEAVCPFFAILSLWLNLEFILLRWRDPAPRLAASRGAAGLVVSIALYKLKPAFGLGVIVAAAPVLASLFQPGVSRRLKTAMVGGAALVGGFGLILPESLLQRADPGGSLFLPGLLFTIHADIIETQLDRDLARGVPAPYPRELLAALRDRLRAALPASRAPDRHIYPSLGFDPDYLLFTDSVFRPAFSGSPADNRLQAGVAYYCYRRAALRQPGRMLGKVWRQLRCFYRFDSQYNDNPYHLRTAAFQANYQRNTDLLGDRDFAPMPSCPPVLAFRDQSARLAESGELRVPIAGHFAGGIFRRLLRCYLPGLLATLATGGWALWNRGRRRVWLAPTLAILLVYGYNLGNNLTVAIVHSLDVGRYIANQLAFTLFASAAGLAYTGVTLWKFIGPPGRPVAVGRRVAETRPAGAAADSPG